MGGRLAPNPELVEWAERHLIDPSRVVAPFDVRPAPTLEHPRQVRVDYTRVTFDESGLIVGRDARSFLTCDPPPGWPQPSTPEQTRDAATVDRLRALVDAGRRFGVAAFTYEQIVRVLEGPADDE